MRKDLRSLVLAAALAVAWLGATIVPATPQNCGTGNPNCIAPTPPVGDNSNRIATTKFVHDAVPSLALLNGRIFVGDASNLAIGVAMSGAVAITNTGVTSLASAAFANPTASVGLAAVNGSAATALRSDAAPALSQAISPTWSGNHVFSNPITVPTIYGGTSAGQVLTIKGTSNASPAGDSTLFASGTQNIWRFSPNPAGNVGGIYLNCWPGNDLNQQNAECDIVSSISTGGLSLRQKGNWPFVLHAPVDQSSSAQICLYENELNGAQRMCLYAADSIATTFTLIWPNALPAGNNYPLTGSASGALSWVAGLSVTKTIRASGGAADCTLIFTGGILTSGSC